MKKLLLTLLIVLIVSIPVNAFRMAAGETNQYIHFVAVDSTDFHTRETGLSSFTVVYTINSGTPVTMTTPTIAEANSTTMPGVYDLLIDEAGMTTLTAGDDTVELCLHITQSSMDPVTRVIEIYRPETTLGQTLTVSTGVGSANTMEVYNVAIPEPNRAGYQDVTTSFVGDVPARPISRANIVADATTGAGAAVDANMTIVLAELAEADANNLAILADTEAWDTAAEARTMLSGKNMPLSVNLFSTTLSSVTDQTHVVLASGPPDDDALNGCIAVFQDVSTATQRGMASVEDYAVTGGGTVFTVTLANAPPFTISATDHVTFSPLPEITATVDITQTVGEAIADYVWADSDAWLRTTTVASATSNSSFTLTAGKQSVNAYLYHTIAITDAGDSNVEERIIVGYTAGRVCLVDRPFSFLPAGSDVARISLGAYTIPKKGVR